MDIIINFLKKHISFSNFWVRNGVILLAISFVVNHLSERKNFPLSDSYSFPWLSILASMLMGTIIIVISYYNYRYYKTKFFCEKVNTKNILYFLFSTLTYISAAYIVFYFIVVGFSDGNYNLYGFLTGIFTTLLISCLVISASFAKDIYKLHKMTSINGKLKVQQAGKIILINYNEIFSIYSENKIVYVAKSDGSTVITDFTLNEVENIVSEQFFFRANRQIILHLQSIEQVQSIENAKLSVQLKTTNSNKKAFQINISRYKRQAFMDWFKNKM